MFCGWGHTRQCRCIVCIELFHMSRSAAYRKGLRRRKQQMLREIDMGLQKPRPGEMIGPVAPPFRDEEFVATFPNLSEHLLTAQYDDGTVRATSTLSVFSDGMAIKMVLNDRDNNRSAFFSEPTFMGTLLAIETALKEGRVDWKMKGTRTGDPNKVPW